LVDCLFLAVVAEPHRCIIATAEEIAEYVCLCSVISS
jgi:hypothetical protein